MNELCAGPAMTRYSASRDVLYTAPPGTDDTADDVAEDGSDARATPADD